MRIDPAIARLTDDPAPLAGAGEAIRAWRASQAVAPVLAELECYGRDAPFAQCATLAALMTHEGGGTFARSVGTFAPAVLRKAELAALPWRHFSNGVLHSVTLAAYGRASLSLALIDGAAWQSARDPAAPARVAFQPGELHAFVVAGRADARILRNPELADEAGAIASRALELEPGVAYALDGTREALALDSIAGHLLTLRLYRAGDGTVPARQYDLASGALVHQAASDQRDSRAELAMALLRAMERSDAAPAIAVLARGGTPAARWQALRECLALDSGVGFRSLLEVAANPGDPLAAPAAALAERLAAAHPALAGIREAALCPA